MLQGEDSSSELSVLNFTADTETQLLSVPSSTVEVPALGTVGSKHVAAAVASGTLSKAKANVRLDIRCPHSAAECTTGILYAFVTLQSL